MQKVVVIPELIIYSKIINCILYGFYMICLNLGSDCLWHGHLFKSWR